MVTTSTSTRAAVKRPVIGLKATVRKGKAADKLPGEDPIVRHMAKPTEAIWVNSLTDAGMFHRDALQLELAVGLSLFASMNDGTRMIDAKRALRKIYEKAGYACATPQGEDYKTVARRIGVAADLFTFIGGKETIIDWVEDATASKQIPALVAHLKTFNFDGINSVLAYINKPVTKRQRLADKNEDNKAVPAELSAEDKALAMLLDKQVAERRAAEEQGIPPGRIFSHGTMQAVVPFTATYDDVMALVQDLMLFAKTQMPLPVEKLPETGLTLVQ